MFRGIFSIFSHISFHLKISDIKDFNPKKHSLAPMDLLIIHFSIDGSMIKIASDQLKPPLCPDKLTRYSIHRAREKFF